MSTYYGSSGDVRADLNGGLGVDHSNYMGETQVPGALIERGRRWAYSVINAKLEPSYPDNVPWTPASEPDLIYEISNLLSQYFVLTKQNLGAEELDKHKKSSLYTEPIKMLDNLATFEMQLSELPSPLGLDVYHSRKDYVPVCDMDDYDNQTIDPDLLEDVADDRDK